jgi:sterol desaturase/sphingolipid hydroxylase (fatty acid hydroxylase superfamily)
MKVDYIALSIPIFFILIGIEFLFSIRKKIRLYRLNDSITNISLGIGQQITGIFMKTALFFGYLHLYDHYRFTTLETSFVVWLILFIGVDFFYYWFHRMSHEVNALWAAHIVHHQSEDYNLSVALRQSWFQNAFSWVFYLPLALAGFHPVMFLTVSSFNTLYQFWIHTRTIGKLGPLEWILNTPSHHRVHHGSDPVYLDKNHGGTLIIWDRLFGTFKEEEKEPHYGITAPLKSWNPVWANLHYWTDLFQMASQSKGIRNKILVFLKPPGWRPDELGGSIIPKEIDDSQYSKFDADASKPVSKYLLTQFTVTLLLSVWVLFSAPKLEFLPLFAASSYIIFAIAVFGAMFERKSWSAAAEKWRLISTSLIFLTLFNHPAFIYIMTGALIYTIVSWLFFNQSLTEQH